MTRKQLPPQITKVSLKSGATRYQLSVAVTDTAGKRRWIKRRFETEAAARRELATVSGQSASGTYVGKATITLEDAIETYLGGRHGLRPATLAGYRAVMVPVVSELGEIAVQKITKSDIDDLVARLRAGGIAKAVRGGHSAVTRPWKPRSVNLMLTVLGAVLDSEMKQGRVARNVVTLVDRIPQERKSLSTFTAGEVRQFLDSVATDRIRHAWHLALSGLRRGEICGLRWADVDLDNGMLTVGNNRVMAGAEIVENGPKTAASARTLPLTPELAAELRSAKARQAVERLALGTDYGPGAHVVVDEVGDPLRPDTLSARWERAVTAAGVPTIRLHDARHTCATLMHLQAVPLSVISAWLGHTDASFTLRTYAHSQNDALKAAATSYGALVSKRVNESK
ncbi:site-specific integrase [Williamsia muralis]|uniref:Tyrosine-type recombinase/integrase n=1 Tax=Williamsia marianensis TaxID=85044 RepID=A0ABU4F101_WILMA|nr:tyrosine-type recombinase/integrase [Williamsia muralis]MDV7137176.1 tyrosine-type recombinase/integrase [Williamsia muralis]